MVRQPSKRQIASELKRASKSSGQHISGRGITITRVNEKGKSTRVLSSTSKLYAPISDLDGSDKQAIQEELVKSVEEEELTKKEFTQVRSVRFIRGTY